MAFVEDRWFSEVEVAGQLVKVATARNGVGLRYRATWRDPHGKQRSKSFQSKLDADRYLTSIEDSIERGEYIGRSRGKITIGKLADEWMASRSDIRPSTRARYEQAIETHIRPQWGATSVSSVDHSAIQAWLGKLSRGELSGRKQSAGSVRKISIVFSGILGAAVRGKRISASPAVGVKLPRSQPGRHTYLTQKELEAMAKAAGYGHLVVLTLGYTGLRWSEVAGLQAEDLDVARNRLSISRRMVEINGGEAVIGPVKDYERREVPLPPSLTAELALHVEGKAPSHPMFTGERGGRLRNRTARRSWFDRAAAEIGHPELTPHGMRHVAASLAIQSGANVIAVSRMLGHSDPSVTLKIYGHLWDSD